MGNPDVVAWGVTRVIGWEWKIYQLVDMYNPASKGVNPTTAKYISTIYGR